MLGDTQTSLSKLMTEYVDRVIPDYFPLLGVSLRPFSIGHALLMQKHNCAYIKDNSFVTIPDLLLGICICSRTHKEFLEFLDDPNGPDWVRKLNLSVASIINEGEFDYTYYLKQFFIYMKRGIKEPMVLLENDSGWKGGEAKSNPYSNLRDMLIREYNYNAETVMDAPVSSGVFDVYKFAEGKGDISIIEW